MATGTVFAEKLAEKGITARAVELNLALAKFVNNHGTYDEAIRLVDAAFGVDRYEHAGRTLRERRELLREGSEGQIVSAGGQSPRADASAATNESEGHVRSAAKAGSGLPSLSPKNGAGRSVRAEQQAVVVEPRPVTKMPGHAKRGAGSAALVQETMAKSLFDSTLLPDGRRLREVRWSECPNLAGKYRRLSRVLMAIHNVGVPSDPDTTIDNIVGEASLQEIILAVERFNDIH